MIESILRKILKIWMFRFLYVYTRYLILDITFGTRTFYKKEDKKLKNLAILNSGTTIQHNLEYSKKKNIFSNYSFNISEYLGLRSNRLLNPLFSLSHIDIPNAKVLSIGPRTEGEIYNLFIKGFKFKNIHAIDLISYSKKIKLCDAHDISYPNNYFDIIICSYTMTYSTNQKKLSKEIVRCCKNNGIAAISMSLHKKNYRINRNTKERTNNIKNSLELKKLFTKNINKIYFQNFSDDFKRTDKSQNIFLIFGLKK
jgi:SAM-dependent methyltransferase